MLTITPVQTYLADTPCAPASFRAYRTTYADVMPALVLEWDKAPGMFWTLSLTEFFGDATACWGYQPHAAWQANSDNGWSYTDAPASAEAGYEASCSASVTPRADALGFQLTLRNTGRQTRADCWGWVCLTHRWAESFQAFRELPTGAGDDAWVPAAVLPGRVERWLKWCGVRGKEDIGRRLGKLYPNRWQSQVCGQRGSTRAWRITDAADRQQFIQFDSDDAVLLGWGHTPCTDVGLYFGTLEPGQSAVVSGQVRFLDRSFTPIV